MKKENYSYSSYYLLYPLWAFDTTGGGEKFSMSN
jgi:hypothetical protein